MLAFSPLSGVPAHPPARTAALFRRENHRIGGVAVSRYARFHTVFCLRKHLDAPLINQPLRVDETGIRLTDMADIERKPTVKVAALVEIEA